MPQSQTRSSVPAATRPQLELTIALARERLMEVHFGYVMELIEHAQREVEPRRAVNIYARLHKLTDSEAEALCHEVFVALGRKVLQKPTESEAETKEMLWEAPESILRQIRRRLRGRVNTELREWVEYHTGRAEAAILWAHVENALRFIALLESSCSAAEAVGIYAEELGIPAPRTEMIYYLALDHRSLATDPSAPANAAQIPRSRRAARGARQPVLKIVRTRGEGDRKTAG